MAELEPAPLSARSARTRPLSSRTDALVVAWCASNATYFVVRFTRAALAMTFKRAIWYPIAVVLSVVNLAGVIAFAAQPWHAASHAALAVVFGLWARRLRQGPGGSELQGPAGSELQTRLEAFEAEVSKLRQELSET